MTQWNTCTSKYINELTKGNNIGDSISGFKRVSIHVRIKVRIGSTKEKNGENTEQTRIFNNRLSDIRFDLSL